MKTKMSRPLRWLVISSILYILFSLIASAIAIAENRPAQFGGASTGLPALQDFLYGQGTAMSPPLYWLAAQALLTFIATRRGRWGVAGIVALIIIGLLFGLGGLGEPILREIFNPATFDLLKAVVVTAMLILALAMIAFGVLELLRRRQT